MFRRDRSRSRPRILALVTYAYLAWTLAPTLLLVRLSLSEAEPEQGGLSVLTVRPYLDVLRSPALRAALEQSLTLALLTTAIAVPLAIGLALGLSRSRGALAGIARTLALGPLAVPETFLATGFFMLFVHLFTFVRLASTAQLLAHVTLVLPFATLILLSSLLTTASEHEEAARDLGASPVAALLLVVLPLIAPAVIAAATVTFALSLNDLVMSHFLCIDSACATVPIVLFGIGEPTPLSSAMAVLLVGLSLPPVLLAWAALRWWAKIGLRLSFYEPPIN
jgi:spermidine/putrescine transport system permease protein